MSSPSNALSPNPLRTGTPEQFATVREAALRDGYQYEQVMTHCHLHKLSDTGFDVSFRRLEETTPAFQSWARLFLQGKPVSSQELRGRLGTDVVAAMESLGLAFAEGEEHVATVALYPVRGVLVVSDRWSSPDDRPYEPPADVVYPAIINTTRGFLDALPTSPCESFLDLCTGSGVAALIAGQQYARQAYGYDIAERSVAFAEFNRRLNGLDNTQFAAGDLYEPGKDLTYDRIVAHPPYVPVLKPQYIFFDGGEDGEQITRRMVQELPRYLRPGGAFYCVAMGTDRKDRTWEQRVRGWLGDAHQEYDIAVVVRQQIEPAFHAYRNLAKGGTLEEVNQWKALFTQLQIQQMIFGALVIQRHNQSRDGFTVRRTYGPVTNATQLSWLMQWESSVATGEARQLLLNRPLLAAPQTDLRVRHRLENGEWNALEYRLQIDVPFLMETETQGWVVQLLSLCDGTRTGRQLLVHLRVEGILHPETPEEAFAEGLVTLASGGFVTLPA